MKAVSLIFALFLVESLGFPQVPPPPGQDVLADPSLVSPWSQWMSLKAPPISLVKPKKKLLPGPPPPEGTPEAPWVTWTRMKVSTALAPPVPPPPPPPSPVSLESGDSTGSSNTSTPEQAVWIQWTQMKLPLASPLAPASPAQETPWDAWTKLKLPLAQPQIPATAAAGPSVSKRMAPDRYSIASTVAPRITAWPQQQSSSSGEQVTSSSLPQQQFRIPPVSSTSLVNSNLALRGGVQSSPPSTLQLFLDVIRPNQPPITGVRPASGDVELPANLAALVESTPELARLSPKIRNQVLEELGLLSSQVSPIPTTTPSTLSKRPGGPLPAKSDISKVLSALPPPILNQLIATTSPAAVQKLIEAINASPSTNIPSPAPTPAAAPAVLSMIPEPVRSQILEKATSTELAQIIGVLSKLEEAIPVERPLLQNVEVATILPPSLVQKIINPEVAPLLKTKLVIPQVPPTALLSSSIPEPILSAILSVANPLEIVELAENLEKVEELAPVQTPSIAALLPSTLIAKLSPAVIPVLTKVKPEKVPAPITVKSTVPAEITTVVTAIPAPLLKEILAEATPAELTEVVENLIQLEKVQPLPKPPVAALLPASLLQKLPPALAPLLTKEIVLPPPSTTEVPAEVLTVLSAIPEQLQNEILKVAIPEELAQLAETISSLEGPTPEKKPISALLPPSLLPKLSASVVPLINAPVVIPAKPISPTPEVIPVGTINAILSILPEPVVPAILAKATPEELTELVNTVVKLAALPLEAKPLISKLEVSTILPPTLLAKLPPSLTPLLEKKIDIASLIGPEAPQVLPSAPVPPLVPVTTATILSILPPAIIPPIIATATPEELAELVERVEKLEAIPEEEKALLSTVKVAALLPPSLLPKLPTSLAPLLAKDIDIKDLSALTALKPVPTEAPLIPSATVAVLSVLPPAIISPLIEKATPEELAELVERVEKLKAIPEEEKALMPSVEVAAILPPSLIAKLPVEVIPLLEKGVVISDLPSTIPAPPPVVSVVNTPPTLTAVLSVLPPEIVPEILIKATPEELTELAAAIAKLEAVPVEQIPTVKVADVLPPTLLAKLSPEALPLIGKEVVIIPSSPPVSTKIPTVVAAPIPMPPSLPAKVLPLLPKEVVSEILAKATPDELTELINAIESLEAIPAEALPKLALGSIIPPTLVTKLSPEVLPLLNKEVIIPQDLIPATAPVPLTPEATEAVPPELKSIPEPLLSTILAVATPAELEEIVKTVEQLEAIPPEQKSVLPKLPIASVLPATLLPKLPPAVLPLLSLELPPAPEPVKIPVEVPVLQAIPEPLLGKILEVASPLEVEQLVETLTELDNLPLELKALLPKPLTITAVLPPTLLPKLPSEILPLLNKEVTPEAIVPKAEVTPPSAILPVTPLPTISEEEPWLEYLKSVYGIPETVPEVVTPAPPAPSTEAAPTKAEEKLLTKWAKIILEKTGKPVASVPGEIPPLQAAWMEWIQLQMNETKKAEAATITTTPKPPVAPGESTTEYPWTKWLKLKSSTPPSAAAIVPGTPVPALDVGTESPEKATLEWLEALEKAAEKPAAIALPPAITPEMEEKVVELLKELGIENVALSPEQITALAEALAAGAVPPETIDVASPPSEPLPPPPPSFVPPPPPPSSPVFPPAYSTYLQPSPFYPSPYWAPPPSPYMPYMGVPPPSPPNQVAAAAIPESPSTVNLTQYLIANKLIPAGATPFAPVPIPELAKILEAQTETTEESSSASNEVVGSTPRTITSSELAALTPTKFAALLKQILKDCNSSNILVTRSTHSKTKSKAKGGGAGEAGGGFNWMTLKNQYKPNFAAPPAKVMRGKRALLPIPSQGVSAPPPQLAQVSNDLLPLPSLSMPKVETAGTVLDPAFWAAQKSMFLSKLFSTLAKVALNDSAQQDSTTLSPKDQLVKQVNSVLLNSMTRSLKHQQPETEEEEEYESSDEDQQNVDENELVTNDNSEPNLPKEPGNPLHKLFKFGVQKTVLSDLSTPAPEPQPIYVYVTSPPPPLEINATPSLDKQKEMMNKLKKVYNENKQLKKKMKDKKRKYKVKAPSKATGYSNSNSHHHNKNHPFRKTTPATTENPVDFELLAKALLVDNKTKK